MDTLSKESNKIAVGVRVHGFLYKARPGQARPGKGRDRAEVRDRGMPGMMVTQVSHKMVVLQAPCMATVSVSVSLSLCASVALLLLIVWAWKRAVRNNGPVLCQTPTLLNE